MRAPFRAGLQTREIEQDSGLCHLLVILRHRGNQIVVRHHTGFGSLVALTNIINRIDLTSFGCHTGAKRTAATGGSRTSGMNQEPPPASEIQNPPLVEPKASRSPVS